ncbi:MAG: fibronectin type III domain-containing protein [Ignavibacteria bacterium]|nr:fibronectin type III domain-containing protein [Ignavibacteria bacterium]
MLPVELSSFMSSVSGRNVDLNWTTSQETNNAGFDIERRDARGGTQDVWMKIATVSGNGTTSSPQNYSYTDRNLTSGNYNYRLKQTDFNGNLSILI